MSAGASHALGLWLDGLVGIGWEVDGKVAALASGSRGGFWGFHS